MMMIVVVKFVLAIQSYLIGKISFKNAANWQSLLRTGKSCTAPVTLF